MKRGLILLREDAVLIKDEETVDGEPLLLSDSEGTASGTEESIAVIVRQCGIHSGRDDRQSSITRVVKMHRGRIRFKQAVKPTGERCV